MNLVIGTESAKPTSARRAVRPLRQAVVRRRRPEITGRAYGNDTSRTSATALDRAVQPGTRMLPARKAGPMGPGARPVGPAGLVRRSMVSLVLALGCLQALAQPAASPSTQPGADPARPQGWLGVTLGNPTRPPAEVDATAPEGVPVAAVVADSPARRAGLRGRDRILAVNGKQVSSPSELMSAIKATPPSEWVSLSVRRGSRTMELRAFLEERPENPGGLRTLEGWIGVEAIDLPPDLREHFGAPRESGVMISHIAPGSPAEAGGLSLGDVVYEVNGEPIPSARALAMAVSGGGVENRLEIRAMRFGSEITFEPVVAVRPEKDPGTGKD